MDLENGKIINLMKFNIVEVAGDASYRKFYRLKLKKKKIKFLFYQKKKNIKI